MIRVVTAHEIAHHVQELLQFEGRDATTRGGLGNSKAIELQADCLAGVWAQDAAERGVVPASDI